MPKIDIAAAPVVTGSYYPAPHGAEFTGRVRRRLGDAVGIESFGVNLTTLPPGGRSSLRHWHEVEEELVFVLEGELTLIDDDGETRVGAGEAAGFPANTANGHHFVNRGDRPAVFLEIGTRPARDRCHYSDVDMICVDEEDDKFVFVRRDGTPIE